MLTIFCGDDTVRSRINYLSEREKEKSRGGQAYDLSNVSLAEVIGGSLSQDLFSARNYFFGENLLSDKKNRHLLSSDNSASIILYEDKYDSWLLKKMFPKAKIIISKLPENIFTFLDGLYPSNKAVVIKSLYSVSYEIDPNFILSMLEKRVKQLLTLEHKSAGPSTWQTARLSRQKKQWPSERLEQFYSKLIRIDRNSKTGESYYNIIDSLSILLCYYL